MTRHSPMAIQRAADRAMLRARLAHDNLPTLWPRSVSMAMALVMLEEAGAPSEYYNLISALLDKAVDYELDATTEGREDAALVAERVAAGMAEG